MPTLTRGTDPGATVSGHTVTVHPNGNWALSVNGSTIEVWTWTGTAYGSLVETESSVDAHFPQAVAFDSTGAYMAVGLNVSPFIAVYPFNASTGAISAKISDPATLPSAQTIPRWTSDDSYIIAGQDGAVPVIAWDWTGSAFGSKVADPADVSGFDSFDDIRGIAITSDDAAVIVNVDGDKIAAWAWTGTAWGTRYTDGTSPAGALTGLTINSTDTAIAMGSDGGSPGSNLHCYIYPWSTATGFGTVIPSPTLGTSTWSTTVLPDFHPSKSLLACPINSHGGDPGQNEPILAVWEINGTAFGSSVSAPVPDTGKQGYAVRWHPTTDYLFLDDSEDMGAYQYGADTAGQGQILIDTDESGTYDYPDENITGKVRANPGIRLTRGRDQAREISPPRAGEASLELDNVDGTYDPPSTFGEGKSLQIRVPHAGTTYNLWDGIVQSVRNHPEIDRQVVAYRAYGRLHRLATRSGLKTQVYSNIKTGTAMGHLLVAAGFAATEYELDTGQNTLLYWWIDPDDNLLTKLNELLASEGAPAAVYEAGGSDAGKIIFKDRHARSTETRSTTIQATFRGTATEPVMSGDFRYETGERDRINTATMTVYRRDEVPADPTPATVWTYGQQIVLSSNEVRDFQVSQPDGTPIVDAILPGVGVDYTLASGSVGITIDEFSGSAIIMTLTAGPSGAVIDDMSMRGQSLAITSRTVINNSLAPTGWTTGTWPFGITPLRPFPDRYKPSPEIGRATALGLMNLSIAYYQNARPQVFFSVIGQRHDDAMAAILPREIGDRVRVIENRYGIDFEGHIEQISYTLGAGPLVIAHFGVEAIAGGEATVLDTDTLDSTAVLG